MIRIFFTIGSWIFISLLTLACFLSNKEKDIRTKIYKALLIFTLALLISEIISTSTFLLTDNHWWRLITLKINWSIPIIWFFLLGCYCVSVINNIEADSFKSFYTENKVVKVLLFVTAVVLFIFILAPIGDLKKISYLPGISSYIVIGFGALVIMSVILRAIIKKNTDRNVRFALISFVLTISITMTIQFFFQGIALETFGVSIQMLLLYFSVENPDIKSAKQLKILQESVDKSNKTKSEFLTNISNNIAEPVENIIANCKNILNSDTYDEALAKENISKISKAGNSLLSTIDNILDVTILESNNNDALQENNYLTMNLLKDLITVINNSVQDKHIQLILDIDTKIPKKLQGDYNKLYQTLLNLLTNAVKYTNIGKVKFSAESFIDDGICTLKFKVSDTGQGMKKELVDGIKAEFNKKEEEEKGKKEDVKEEQSPLGVGLSLVKKYSELMGAKVDLDSEYGAGSTFRLTVEQKVVDEEPIGPTDYLTNEVKIASYLDCSNYNVLIVDDDELNVKVATRILNLYKFNVETLDNGHDCIYNIKLGKKYDIIFIDHMMHGIDGIETMHKLRKLEDYTIPPIVVLTANVISGMREKYIDEGFDDYVAKPIKKEDLDTVIRKYFNKK